jgi:hypothetical protein
MYLIYLSPHLDDAIYSCGGIIYSQIQIGDRVEIWSLFTSDPPKHGLTQFALELRGGGILITRIVFTATIQRLGKQ